MTAAWTHRARCRSSGCTYPTQGPGSSFTPATLPGLVDEWSAEAAYCTTDAAYEGVGSASPEYLNRSVAAGFAPQDNAWSCAFWAYRDTTSGTMYWAGLGWVNAGDGWNIVSSNASDTISFTVRDAADSGTAAASSTMAAGGWHLVVVTHDPTANEIAISVDGGTPSTTSLSGGTYASTQDFQIGCLSTTQYELDGRVQGFGIWSGRVLDSDDIAALYNSGNGTLYEDLSASLKTSLVSWWNLHEASGARVDSHGSNDLTAVNSPGVAAGVAEGTVQDRAPVKTWTGKVNGVELSQPDITKQPLWIESGQNGRPTLRGDGVDDTMATAAFGAAVTSPHTLYLAAETPSGADSLADGIAGTNRHALFGSTTLALYAGASLASGDITLGGAFHIITSSTGASGFIRGNGSGGNTGNAGTQTLTGLTLFSRHDGGVSGDVDISHAVLQEGAPTDDDRDNMEAFLNARYAVY